MREIVKSSLEEEHNELAVVSAISKNVQMPPHTSQLLAEQSKEITMAYKKKKKSKEPLGSQKGMEKIISRKGLNTTKKCQQNKKQA